MSSIEEQFKTSRGISINARGNIPKDNKIYTMDGQTLTPKEARFIDVYLETGNGAEAARKAGYKAKDYSQKAYSIQRNSKVANEILARQAKIRSDSMITVEEIYNYLSRVVRGEEKDQFGLEVPISERTKAATELLKRWVDIPNKLQGNEVPEVKVTIDWARPDPLDVIVKDAYFKPIEEETDSFVGVKSYQNEENEVENGLLTTQIGD